MGGEEINGHNLLALLTSSLTAVIRKVCKNNYSGHWWFRTSLL